MEVTNVSDSVLEDLKIDAFADDEEPTLIVSTRLEEEASDLQPGQSLTCRVSCACRAPFVVPPELAVRFESEGKRYAYALRLPVAVTCFAQPDGYNARDVGAFRRRWDECGGFDGSEKQVVVAARGAVDVDALDDVRQRIVGGALRGALVRGRTRRPRRRYRLADQHDGRRRGGRAGAAGGERGGAGVSGHSQVAVARRRRVQERRTPDHPGVDPDAVHVRVFAVYRSRLFRISRTTFLPSASRRHWLADEALTPILMNKIHIHMQYNAAAPAPPRAATNTPSTAPARRRARPAPATRATRGT